MSFLDHALLGEIFAAHGGRERWAGLTQITAHARSGGLLPWMKGRARALGEFEISVSTREPVAVLSPFPAPGMRGVFGGDRVRIEAEGGGVVAERQDAREAFFGFGRLRRAFRWDELDALYFAGYAFWNYLNTPRLFDDSRIEAREIAPWRRRRFTWRRLQVTFPEGFHTHSRRQIFYFDDDGRLRRHDYTAEVVGPIARAAHLCDEHRSFDGLLFPTRRRVVPRAPLRRTFPAPTLVAIELDSIAIS